MIKQNRKIKKAHNKNNSKNQIRKNLYNEIKQQPQIDKIVNLGNFELTNGQTNVLNKGLGSVHMPKRLRLETILHSLSDVKRRMFIQHYFARHPPKQNLEPFRAKSRWIPPASECENIEDCLRRVEKDLIKPHNNTRGNPDNLARDEIKAFRIKSKQRHNQKGG